MVRLIVRRFRCAVGSCRMRTCAERLHPDVEAVYARRAFLGHAGCGLHERSGKERRVSADPVRLRPAVWLSPARLRLPRPLRSRLWQALRPRVRLSSRIRLLIIEQAGALSAPALDAWLLRHPMASRAEDALCDLGVSLISLLSFVGRLLHLGRDVLHAKLLGVRGHGSKGRDPVMKGKLAAGDDAEIA